MYKTKGFAAKSEKSPLAPFDFERRDLRPHDVLIDILYCGVCHSDLHTARNEWKGTIYPCVPGHEIVGRVTAIGKDVKKFKVGDMAGVGPMTNTCRKCENCKDDLQQYCTGGMEQAYNTKDKIDGSTSYGGYSTQFICDEDYTLHIPNTFKENDLAGVAPLLCAGITTYSPLRHWGVKKGSKVGVVGLGGLGHMALKLAHAMGAHVILFTTSAGKAEDAKRMGADEIVITKDPKELEKYNGTLDLIVNTVAAPHNLDMFVKCLKRDGVLCLVGAPPSPHDSPEVVNLIFSRRSIAGSLIGSIKETQEMLDFCGKNHITADVEVIPMQKINEAYERMLKSDVKYRFVVDMKSLKA